MVNKPSGHIDSIIEDLELILPCSKIHATKRLGYKNPNSLYRMLLRKNRLDLWFKLEGSEGNGGNHSGRRQMVPNLLRFNTAKSERKV